MSTYVEPDVITLDRQQGREMLNDRTMRLLHITLDEFERRYDAGSLDESNPHVAYLVTLLPFAR